MKPSLVLQPHPVLSPWTRFLIAWHCIGTIAGTRMIMAVRKGSK